jgi:hypothetical protein
MLMSILFISFLVILPCIEPLVYYIGLTKAKTRI